MAVALLKRFAFGLHLPVDDLRGMVVSGIAHPVPQWTEETSRQFDLARRAAVQTARLYAATGFAVAIDDVISVPEVNQLENQLSGFAVRKVLLRPPLEVALQRNARRTNKDFDTRVLEGTIRGVYEWMKPDEYADAGWRVMDSGWWGVEETVAAILEWDSSLA